MTRRGKAHREASLGPGLSTAASLGLQQPFTGGLISLVSAALPTRILPPPHPLVTISHLCLSFLIVWFWLAVFTLSSQPSTQILWKKDANVHNNYIVNP